MSEPTGIRWGRRFALDIGVRIFNGSKLLGNGRIINASASGAYVETYVSLPLHSNIRLQLIPVGGKTVTAGEVHACVLRVDIHGLGVEWRDMACPVVATILNREMQRTSASARAAELHCPLE